VVAVSLKNDLQLGAGGQRASFKASMYLGAEFLQLVDRLTTDDVFGDRMGRDDVGSVTTFGNDAVYAIGGADVLA
jgi:hypothetical protein